MPQRPGRSQTGDPSDPGVRLANWLEAYGDELFAYARRRVENDQVAEELVQETFLGALKNLNQFGGRSAPKTWLIAILRNKLIAYYRQRERRRGSSLDPRAEPQYFDRRGTWQVPVGRWPRLPHDTLEQQEFWQAFDQCLAKLPPPVAEVFVLRVLDGLDSEKICNELGISSSNLAVRLHRARLALRNCLETNWFGSD